VVGGGLGWLVDSLLSTSPAFLLTGLAIGIVGACAYTIAQFRKYLSN
jgi:F0F1-type ATP synthase assembly protein I